MAPGHTVESLQNALVEMGVGGQAAVLPLIVEGSPDAAVLSKVREAHACGRWM